MRKRPALALLVLVAFLSTFFGPAGYIRHSARWAPPATPASFTVTQRPHRELLLTWDADDTENTVEVERAPDVAGSPGTYAQIGVVDRCDASGFCTPTDGTPLAPAGAIAESHYDLTVSNATKYWYRIRTCNVDGCSAYTSAASATVADSGAAPSASAGSDKAVELGVPVGFDAEASRGIAVRAVSDSGAYAVVWDFGDNRGEYSITRNVLNPSHVYKAAGVYTATLTIRNDSGATSVDTATVTVTAIPTPTGADVVDMGSPTNSCAVPANCYISNLSDGAGNLTKFNAAVAYAAARTSSGQLIKIPAGAQFSGITFTPLPARGVANWLTIEASNYSNYARGTRIAEAQVDSGLMPTFILTGNNVDPTTATGASYIRFRGIKFQQDDAAIENTWLMRFGDYNNEASDAAMGHHLLAEHCAFVVPGASRIARRGLIITAHDSAVTDSWFEGIKHTGSEASAILLHCGKRMAANNNYFEGSTQVTMVGGFVSANEKCVPENLEMRDNALVKPLSWLPGNAHFTNPLYAGTSFAVKNSVEFKSGRYVTFKGNYVLRSWSAGQEYMVIIRAGGDTGAAMTTDFDYSYNWHKSMAHTVTTLGCEDYPRCVARVLIEQNVFEDNRREKWYQGGVYNSPDINPMLGGADIWFNHNSFVDRPIPGGFTSLRFNKWAGDNYKYYRFGFTNNVHLDPDHPDVYQLYSASSGQTGQTMLSNSSEFSPAGVYTGNLFGLDVTTGMPSGNFYPTTTNFPAQFDNYAGGLFTVASSSAANNGATDGTDPGANVAAVAAATSGALSGVWAGVPAGVRGGVGYRSGVVVR